MEKSPLHSLHLSLGARFAPFAGWKMPIQYKGIVSEHEAVRKSVGVFDISHMGEFEVRGPGAGEWLNGLLTNDNRLLGDGQGQYTLLLNEEGGVIDDLLLYRFGSEHYFLVVNAARVTEDFSWMSKHLPAEGVTLTDRSGQFGAVAVQGPKSLSLWTELAPGLVLPERNGIVRYESCGEMILCRTGYTGEDGFELFASVDKISHWFDQLTASGAIPCGLGARDTLRLEKGFPLNGSDLDEGHTPLEGGLGFFVKLDKENGFVGREALLAQRAAGLSQKLVAIRLQEKAPPLRHGYTVLAADGTTKLGELTSGSLSPGLGLGIGMAYLPVGHVAVGTEVMISIREKLYPAQVVKKPFV